ncbi:MAG: tetratricopeptide repeat protein [Anaerolineae bacterium]
MNYLFTIIPVNLMAAVPNPEFEKRAFALLSEWRKGTFAFAEAVDRLDALKYQALVEQSPANAALIERLLGIVRLSRGHYDHAIRHFRTARDFHGQTGDTERLLMCDNNIGEAHRLKGDLERAHKILQATYEAAVKLGNPLIQAHARSNAGRTLCNMRRYTEAVAVLQHAREVADMPHIRPNMLGLISLIYSDLAFAYLGLNDTSAAFAAADEALKFGLESKELRRQGQAHRALGAVFSVYVPNTDLNTDPDYHFEISVQRARTANFDVDAADTYTLYGESLAKRGRTADALEKLYEAILIYERLELTVECEKVKAILQNL